jgi:hypothetical protein
VAAAQKHAASWDWGLGGIAACANTLKGWSKEGGVQLVVQ